MATRNWTPAAWARAANMEPSNITRFKKPEGSMLKMYTFQKLVDSAGIPFAMGSGDPPVARHLDRDVVTEAVNRDFYVYQSIGEDPHD